MKSKTLFICSMVVFGITLIPFAFSEDRTINEPNYSSGENKMFNDHKNRVDPAREARRLNYMRAKMMTSPASTQKEDTMTTTNNMMQTEETSKRKNIRQIKIFRK